MPSLDAASATGDKLGTLRDDEGFPRSPILKLSGFRRVRTPLPKSDGCRSIVLTDSGESAIDVALQAAGVGAGDQVLVPTYHCPTMIAPAIRLGATPVFYPLSSTGVPDVGYFSGLQPSRAKALLVAHFFGFVRPLDEVRDWCKRHGVALVEDFAHAFFQWGRAISGIERGHFAVASLPKFFPVPEGGCVAALTGSIEASAPRAIRPLLDELRVCLDEVEISAQLGHGGGAWALRSIFRAKRHLWGRMRSLRPRTEQGANEPPRRSTDAELMAVPRKCTRFASWIVEHSDLDRIAARRRRNYGLLVSLLRGVPRLHIIHPDLPEGVVPYVLPLRIQDAGAVYRHLRLHRAPVFRWDVLWPGTPKLPNDRGTEWASEIVQISCHQDLSAADLHRLAAIVREGMTEAACQLS